MNSMWKSARHCCMRTAMRMASNDNYAIAYYCQRYAYLAFQVFMSILGPLMLMAGFTLIGGVYVVFVMYILPSYPSTASKVTHFMIASWLIGSIFFNYASCSLTPPGSPPYCADPGSLLGQRTVVENNREVTYIQTRYEVSPGVEYKFCKTCRAIKPPRSHHCSVAGKCVFHMDHYCPWMNNCVGYFNYRYFYMFLLYLVIGCAYAMTLTFGGFSDAATDM
jgi:palmitoyltransferase